MDTQVTYSAIEQLYHDYHQPILRYLERLVSQRELAEDLAQETFLKAFRAWHQHESPETLRGWLYRIATNTAYDHLRRQRRLLMLPLTDMQASVLSAPQAETHRDDAEPMWNALNRIPDRYRIPLLLHLWAGYNLNDIAAALGCNVNTVKTRVYRARMQFRQHYIA
jgi:RNA polymerase sigma-70 factor (ECF subfamily)